jgi:cation diffusion facilitator CzcD-associated flavoprotein CzcO
MSAGKITLHHIHTRVLIDGADPAGLGVGAALQRAGLDDFLIVDAGEIGSSFRAWPKGMTLLTPRPSCGNSLEPVFKMAGTVLRNGLANG